MADDRMAKSGADTHEGDVLPEELDVTAYVGPYLFPSMRRRRIAGTIYAVLAALCVLGWVATDNAGVARGRGLPRAGRGVPLRRRVAARDRPDRSAC